MKVYGKINLCLRVKNVEKGFHNIDSVMSKIDMYDDVDLNRREKGNLVNALYDGRNTALLALELIQRLKKVDFYSIDIQKGIPFKAGLGGSSADAGFVIKYFLNRGDLSLEEALRISDLVGKDVAFFLDDYPKRVKGLQDDISTIEIASPLQFIFIKPHGGVSTKECYELFDKKPQHNDGDIDALIKGLKTNDLNLIKDNMFNDLENAAIKLNPGIEDALNDLNKIGALKAIMTGSGSGVIGLFNSQDEAREKMHLINNDKYELVKQIETLKI